MRSKVYSVYILVNSRHTVFYVGVTNDLNRRVFEHKVKFYRSFTAKYNCDKLVYFEEFQFINEAIKREKQLKRYKRKWKMNLIDQMNPTWEDLSADWYDPREIENFIR